MEKIPAAHAAKNTKKARRKGKGRSKKAAGAEEAKAEL